MRKIIHKSKPLLFLFISAMLLVCFTPSCKKNNNKNKGTCSDGIKNQDEINIDCGGVCSKCATCNDGIQNQGETGIDCGGPCGTCPIKYPNNGDFGDNFARFDTVIIQSSGVVSNPTPNYYSLRADLPQNTSLKIVMQNLTNSTDNIWHYSLGSYRGWSISQYDFNSNENQVFRATGQITCDVQVYFVGHGSAKLSFYENEALTPVRIKIISW